MKTSVRIGEALSGGAVALACLALCFGGNARGDESSPQSKPYPLKRCVVSGQKLGGKEKSYEFAYEGQTIRLCCSHCLPEFQRQPSQYLAKVERANKKVAKAQAPRIVPPALDDSPGGLAFAGW